MFVLLVPNKFDNRSVCYAVLLRNNQPALLICKMTNRPLGYTLCGVGNNLIKCSENMIHTLFSVQCKT